MRELTTFEKEAIRLAMAKMFRQDGYFDICTVDKCLKIAGAVPDRREHEALSALHCVYFRDMTPAMRQEVAHRTLALFDAPGFDLPQLDRSFLPASEDPQQVPAGLWNRVKGSLHA